MKTGIHPVRLKTDQRLHLVRSRARILSKALAAFVMFLAAGLRLLLPHRSIGTRKASLLGLILKKSVADKTCDRRTSRQNRFVVSPLRIPPGPGFGLRAVKG